MKCAPMAIGAHFMPACRSALQHARLVTIENKYTHMKKIIHVLDIHAPAEKIFHSLNTEEGLSQWWTSKVFYEDAKEGPIHFAFMGDFNPVMKVIETKAPNLIHWECIKGVPAWQNDTLIFQLTPHNDGTTVKFIQVFSNELIEDQAGRFNYIWAYYLQSLRLYCEEGKGNPFSI